MVTTIIRSAICYGTPLLYGSTGEILTEKSGNLNLGIPGIMYVGAINGIIGSFFYEQSLASPAMLNPFLAILIPMLCSMIGAAFMGLIYCFLTVTLRANQNVTGLALTTFGIGIGNFFGGSLIKLSNSTVSAITLNNTGKLFKTPLPFAEHLGWFGEAFLSHGFLVYLAIAIALLASFILNKTRVGLHLRAVGESPETADAVGINVTKYKYLSTCIGSAIAGLGGLYYVMDYSSGGWANNAFGDRGWLAIALVIFSVWKPAVSILGSFLFGLLYVIPIYLNIGGVNAKKLFEMLPYAVTIIVLIITSLSNKKEHQPPEGLGNPYFREER